LDSDIEQSNWSVEHIRAARHSKSICALVLALRKIPIFAPGGGAAALGDPTNPSYSVSVSDEMAVAAREKTAKVADTARLDPKIQQNPGKEQSTTETDNDSPNNTPGHSSEIMAAEAMNVMQLSKSLQDPSDDVGKEKQNLKSVSSRSELPPEGSNIQSEASLGLEKTKIPQGRRRTGSSVPLHVTNTSRQDPQNSQRVSSFGEA